MESSDRKRRGGGEGNGRLPSRPPPEEAVRTAAVDDEVEEFFAVLRHLRDASRFLAARQRAAAPVPDDGSTRWSPEFAWEDFAGPDGVKDVSARVACPPEYGTAAVEEVRRGADTVAPMLLDLNADPEPDGLAAASSLQR